MQTLQQKIDRLKTIFDNCTSKANLHYAIWNNSNLPYSESDYNKYVQYINFQRRASKLALAIQYDRPLGEVPSWRYLDYRDYKANRQRRKQERREKFNSTYRALLWFLSNSFGADYGSFNCENCSREFYHSPATIKKGKQLVHECVCGYCCNRITATDIYN